MTTPLKEIQQALKANANDKALDAQEKFVPGIQKRYGVYMPVLNELAKQYKDFGFELVKELWQAGSWEEYILAGKMLGKISKQDPELSLQLVEKFSSGIHDWAVCDTLGMQALKPIVKTHAKEIFALANNLSKSANLWQRRLALVLVEWYTRDASHHEAIHIIIHRLEKDKEYYVQKAIVWLRRNLKKGK